MEETKMISIEEKERIYKEMMAVIANHGYTVQESYEQIANGFSLFFLCYAYRSSNRAAIDVMPLSDVL